MKDYLNLASLPNDFDGPGISVQRSLVVIKALVGSYLATPSLLPGSISLPSFVD